MGSWALKVGLNWAWGKISGLFLWLYENFKAKKEYKKIKEQNSEQAKKVESAADEIKKLLAAGQPVPEELKEKLREESRRLIDGAFDPDRFQ